MNEIVHFLLLGTGVGQNTPLALVRRKKKHSVAMHAYQNLKISMKPASFKRFKSISFSNRILCTTIVRMAERSKAPV